MSVPNLFASSTLRVSMPLGIKQAQASRATVEAMRSVIPATPPPVGTIRVPDVAQGHVGGALTKALQSHVLPGTKALSTSIRASDFLQQTQLSRTTVEAMRLVTPPPAVGTLGDSAFLPRDTLVCR